MSKETFEKLKREELQRTDNACAEKAAVRGDLTFTVVGQDLSSPQVICEWIKLNMENHHCPDEKLRHALEVALAMRAKPAQEKKLAD